MLQDKYTGRWDIDWPAILTSLKKNSLLSTEAEAESENSTGHSAQAKY
jgi:hypothetical protein